jgi:hypothetical protein
MPVRAWDRKGRHPWQPASVLVHLRVGVRYNVLVGGAGIQDRDVAVWAATEAERKHARGVPEAVRHTAQSLQRCFATQFEAVALDIDGTVTAKGRVLIDVDLAHRIRSLLRRGLRVILLSGRGQSAATVVQQLVNDLPEDRLSEKYLTRLSCLIDNGAAEISVAMGVGQPVVTTERFRIDDPLEVARVISQALEDAHVSPVRVSGQRSRLRLEFDDVGDCDDAFAVLTALRSTEIDLLGSLALSRGEYRGNTYTIDWTPVDKGAALEALCEDLGVDPDRCVRIADRGEETGTDFTMLNHDAGFTVGAISAVIGKCHAVVDAKGTVLVGPTGTTYVLGQLYLSAQLATRRRSRRELVSAFAEFEREVQVLADCERRRVAMDFATSVGNVFSDAPMISGVPTVTHDVFDALSGAVRLHHSEVVSHLAEEPLGRIFDLNRFTFTDEPPRARRAMYSDTAVLLRGPDYYPDWTKEWVSTGYPVTRIVHEMRKFVATALGGIAYQAGLDPSMGRLKLLLGVLDNVRDGVLKVMHLGYAFDSEVDYGPDVRVVDHVAQATATFIDFCCRVHIANRSEWRTLHTECYDALEQVDAMLSFTIGELAAEGVDWIDSGLKLFRSRECDHLLESIAGVRLGLEKHVEQNRAAQTRRFSVVGLVYGAIELPFLAQAIGRLINIEVYPGLLTSASYTRSSLHGEAAELGLMDTELNVWMGAPQHAHTCPVLLADDNMTTARSLQRARDGMVVGGFDVVGAIVVRYPGLNRLVQMYEIDGAIPDPDMLMGFVRGLVTPAPYARRVEPYIGEVGRSTAPANPYLDRHGSFNKSNERIQRHLAKSNPEDGSL